MQTATIKAFPTGQITEDAIQWTDSPLPDIKDGELLVEHVYYSVDPTHRIYLTPRESYFAEFKIGDNIPAAVIGKVVASKADSVPVGTLVAGFGRFGTHSVIPASGATVIPPGQSLEPFMTLFNPIIGLTAVLGVNICEVNRPRAGSKQHCIVISGAAGAVGSLAGQIAKARGARVIGIAGGQEKCDFIRSLGFDEAIDYKAIKDPEALQKAIADAAAPAGGVDSYFDNVGGEISAAVIENFKLGATLALCGAISGYDSADPRGRISFPAWNVILYKRAKVQGFICVDHMDEAAAAYAELKDLHAKGAIKTPKLDVEVGVQKAVTQMRKLTSGANKGKTCVKISE